MVFIPGSPSPVRPRKPPSIATSRAQWWRSLGWASFVEDVGRLHFVRLERQLHFELRAEAPQAHQPGHPPGDYHEQHQSPLQARYRAQLG